LVPLPIVKNVYRTRKPSHAQIGEKRYMSLAPDIPSISIIYTHMLV